MGATDGMLDLVIELARVVHRLRERGHHREADIAERWLEEARARVDVAEALKHFA